MSAESAAPRVSAILPVYNGGRFLAEAIASIHAQGVAQLELIVVDDGSTDGTGQAARRIAPQARHIRQEHAGVAAARNRGLAAARGEFIAFLDHDDVWPAGRLQRQLERMDAAPGPGIVTGRVRVIGQPIPGRAWSQAALPETGPSLLFGAALIRRSVFDAVGMLSEAAGLSDDIEWMQRALDLGVRQEVLDLVTLHYRWHGENTSKDIGAVWDGAAAAIKSRLDRRRRAQPEPRATESDATKTGVVSVVIPVHNGAAHLAEALASVASQASVAETIVIDDGSTDGSAEIASRCGGQVRVVRQARAGAGAARNAGLALARGEAVAFLDHDDVWPPGTLEALLVALQGPPRVDLVYGRMRLFGDGLPPLATALATTPAATSAAAPQGRLEGFGVTLGAALIRRSVFERVGTFDPSLHICEDMDWWMRVRERGCAVALLERVTLWHRVHAGQMTADAKQTILQGAVALKRSLDRRRAGGRAPELLPAWLSQPRSDSPPAPR